MIRSYFRKAGLLSLTEFALRAKGLILIPILTKHFGAVSYGIWAQVSVIVVVLSPLLSLGIDKALVRFLPGASIEDKRAGASTAHLFINMSCVIAWFLLWIVEDSLSQRFFDGADNARFVFLSGFVLIVGANLSFLRGIYRIEDNARLYAAISVVQSLAGTGTAVYAVLTGADVYALIQITASFEAVLAVLLCLHVYRTYGLALPRLSLLRSYLRFALPLLPTGYAAVAMMASDRMFISYYSSLEDLGIYNVAHRISAVFFPLLFGPLWAMYPSRAAELYNQGDTAGYGKLFGFSTKAAFLILVPAVVGLSVLARPLLRALATEEFLPGANLIPIIATGFLLNAVRSYFDIALFLEGRGGRVTMNMVVAASVNIVLNAVLVPKWGALGAAGATAFSQGLNAALAVHAGHGLMPGRVELAFVAKVLLSSATMGAVLTFVPISSHSGLLLAAAAGTTTYAVAVVVVRALPLEICKKVGQLIRPQAA